MKNDIVAQFNNLRIIIRKQVETLNILIKQSEHLAKISSALKTEDGASNDLKKTLDEIRENISNSITKLVKETDELFNTYDKLIEQVFGNDRR